jgi:PEP-CTERM motif
MKVFVSCSFLAICLTLPLAAESITYTMTGDLSGSLNGVNFSDEAFTFVLGGDTGGVSGSALLSNDATSSSISIAGFATTDFTEGVAAGVAGPFAGIINASDTAGIVIGNIGFGGWNLATPLGPLGESGPAFDSGGSFSTGAGTLVIDEFGAENVSFTAATSAVPEPATVGLIALSLFGIALGRRRVRG